MFFLKEINLLIQIINKINKNTKSKVLKTLDANINVNSKKIGSRLKQHSDEHDLMTRLNQTLSPELLI